MVYWTKSSESKALMELMDLMDHFGDKFIMKDTTISEMFK